MRKLYQETLPDGVKHEILKERDDGWVVNNTPGIRRAAGPCVRDGRQPRQLRRQPVHGRGRLRAGRKPRRPRGDPVLLDRCANIPGGNSGNGRSRSAGAGCSSGSIESWSLMAEPLDAILGYTFQPPGSAARGADPSFGRCTATARRTGLQRAAGVHRRPGAWAAHRGMAGRAVSHASRKAIWAAGWPIWCRSRCWPRWRTRSDWGRRCRWRRERLRPASKRAPPSWPTRWRRRWARSISMAGWTLARGFVRRAWNDAMIAQEEPPKDAKTGVAGMGAEARARSAGL